MSTESGQVELVAFKDGQPDNNAATEAKQQMEEEGDITWGEICEGIKNKTGQQWAVTGARVLAISALLYSFLFSLDLMGSSFKILGGCSAGGLFNDVTNPIAGVMIGILGTVLVQSSSTSTSVVVSLVGAGMEVDIAIPIIMGANIGTSVTNTIVSMGQINDVEQFKRAFSGATVHDMFNFLSVGLLLPLELITGFLEHLTAAMVPDEVDDGEKWEGPVKKLVSPLVSQLLVINKKVTSNIAKGDTTCDIIYSDPEETGLIKCSSDYGCPAFYTDNATKDDDFAAGGVCLFLSLIFLVLCLFGLVKVLQSMVLSSSTRALRKATGMNPYVAIIVGAAVTILVQSSSITTSVLTPLVGLDILRLEQMLPLTLGANIGTTATALLASLVSSKPASVQIALCHLFFNITGILIWFPVPFMRNVPLSMARLMGEATARYRAFPIFYILVAFVIVPGILLGVSSLYDLGGAFTVAGVLLTVAIIVCLGLFIRWYKFKDGKASILAAMDGRQARAELRQELPMLLKQLRSDVEANNAAIAALKKGAAPAASTGAEEEMRVSVKV